MKKLILLLLLIPSICFANITVPFTDNFDSYSEGTQLTSPYPSPWYSGLAPLNCGHTTITSNAAYGSSGKGIRYLIGNDKNYNSDSFSYLLTNATNEVWVRFYKRYAYGFAWQGGAPSEEKVLWFSNQSNTDAVIYEHSRNQCWDSVTGQATTDAVHFWLQNNTVNEVSCGQSNTGWVSTQGGSTGDGQWHAYEVHIKKGTTATSTDGILQVWIDGTLKFDKRNVSTGTGWPRDMLHFQVNQDSGNNSPCAPVDFDNLVVYTSTPPNIDSSGNAFIGLVGSNGGSDTTPPVISNGSPSGNLAAGTINTTVAFNTDENATCKYSDTAGVVYSSMTGTVTTTGTTSHSFTASGLSNGNSYSKYIKCIDSSGNANTTDYTITFNILNANSGVITPKNLLFSESFESTVNNTNGWVDGYLADIVPNGISGNAARFSWTQGATQPTNNNTIRKDIGSNSEVYITYWMKFDSSWRGSGQTYHPHLLMLRGTTDYNAGAYDGPAYAYMNQYMEVISDTSSPYAIRPSWSQQDGKRVNASYGTPPIDISNTTETRSAGSCNGIKSTGYQGNYNVCYNISGTSWWSSIGWLSDSVSVPFNTWVKFAYSMKLNTVTNGIANADGRLRIWMNDTEILKQENVIYRTGFYGTDTFRQFMIAPYIGDGAPVAETMYLDELKIYDGYTENFTLAPVSRGTVMFPNH